MSDKKLLVGFAGLAGVGKDSAADYLAMTYNLARYAFAWPIKAAISQAFGIGADVLEDTAKKNQIDTRYMMSPRRMMQEFGDGWAKEHFGDDVWLDIARRGYAGLHLAPEMAEIPGMAISDVRYSNEAAWIREAGVLVHVTRPLSDRYKVDNPGHASEAGIEPLDGEVIITNDGTLEELYDQLDQLAVKLGLEDLENLDAGDE